MTQTLAQMFTIASLAFEVRTKNKTKNPLNNIEMAEKCEEKAQELETITLLENLMDERSPKENELVIGWDGMCGDNGCDWNGNRANESV